MHNKILLTGGSGLLGQELQKHLKCYAPSSRELNIVDMEDFEYDPDVVIHAAAYTDLEAAEGEDREKCFNINIVGTANMVRKFPNAYFVYISSEYAAHPHLNIYSFTKFHAEYYAKEHKDHLIIRTLFKPNPFPHKKAFIDQYTQGDYVDVIAPKIVQAINHHATGLLYVGTGRKSIYQLAVRTRPDVGKMSVDDVVKVRLPHDYLT